MKPTDEMVKFYKERTAKHIELVQKYCNRIDAYETARFNSPFQIAVDPNCGGILETLSEFSESHDASKMTDPELIPYVFITWQYRCRDLGKPFVPPDDLKRMMSEATFHHVKYNPHHPECWDDSVKMQKREDRDIPTTWTATDASKMPDFYIAEMVADWLAMAEEKGTSAKDWADKNVNIRWKFTEKQRNLIYELIQGAA